MKFSELLTEIKATYRTETRAFHVLATRYYLGAETRETLRAQATTRPCHNHAVLSPVLTETEVEVIIANR